MEDLLQLELAKLEEEVQCMPVAPKPDMLSLQRRPEWSAIKTGDLLYIRLDRMSCVAVVTEKLDNSFTIRAKRGGSYLHSIDEFHQNPEKFLWAYQGGVLLSSTKSRGILRPWRKRWNIHSSVKNWRLF